MGDPDECEESFPECWCRHDGLAASRGRVLFHLFSAQHLFLRHCGEQEQQQPNCGQLALAMLALPFASSSLAESRAWKKTMECSPMGRQPLQLQTMTAWYQ